MRHYEIIFLIDSNQSHLGQSDQITSMIQRYTQLVESGKSQSEKSSNAQPVTARKGVVHRLENLGRRLLAYPINKRHKAHYVLINIECEQETLKELQESFHFNDAIMRYLIIKQPHAITEPSILAKEKAMEASENKTESAPLRKKEISESNTAE